MAKRGAWKKAGDSVLTVVLILLSLRLGVKFLLDGGRGRRDFTSCWVWSGWRSPPYGPAVWSKK